MFSLLLSLGNGEGGFYLNKQPEKLIFPFEGQIFDACRIYATRISAPKKVGSCNKYKIIVP
jgi:hypothetical protein